MHYVVPLNQEANHIHGVQVGNDLYINPYNGHNGFIQLAGHELLHHIKRISPAHYQAILQSAREVGFDVRGYTERSPNGSTTATDSLAYNEEELLADFVGDALADTEFLQLLAEDNPFLC